MCAKFYIKKLSNCCNNNKNNKNQQQNNIFIEVDSIIDDTFTDEQIDQIINCYRQGTLSDVVLKDKFLAVAKILGYNATEYRLSISYIYGDSIHSIRINLP